MYFIRARVHRNPIYLPMCTFFRKLFLLYNLQPVEFIISLCAAICDWPERSGRLHNMESISWTPYYALHTVHIEVLSLCRLLSWRVYSRYCFSPWCSVLIFYVDSLLCWCSTFGVAFGVPNRHEGFLSSAVWVYRWSNDSDESSPMMPEVDAFWVSWTLSNALVLYQICNYSSTRFSAY